VHRKVIEERAKNYNTPTSVLGMYVNI
jgi:hypothetical protein